jgi:hypothetical protein
LHYFTFFVVVASVALFSLPASRLSACVSFSTLLSTPNARGISEIIKINPRDKTESLLCILRNRDLEIESAHAGIVKMTVSSLQRLFYTICTVNYPE